MKREDVLQEMKNAVGTKTPVEFFEKMVDVFGLLFSEIERLQQDINRIKTHSALAIQWEPRVASDMLAKQVDILRRGKDLYFVEIDALKKAFAEDRITQNYHDFVKFWQDTLGWHPFLD